MTKKELDAATEGRKASVLGPGDSMGESALVIDSERSATIKVTERSIFYALEKRHFSAFLQVAPKLQDTTCFIQRSDCSYFGEISMLLQVVQNWSK